MKSQQGTYILILHSEVQESVQIGRWQEIKLKQGTYFYVGSAFGSGGVRARVLRHCRQTKSNHWHIDYLRARLNPVGAWYSHDPIRHEHRWAQLLHQWPDTTAIPGFGCSDCRCYSHLFHTTTTPDFALFAKTAVCQVESWLIGDTLEKN